MHRSGLKPSPESSNGIAGVLEMVWSRPAKAAAELLALVFVAFIVIGSPSFAQSQAAPMPANAQPQSYGDGWGCDRGYRRDGDACLAIIIPENAYATNRTYGAGWECLHGFQEADDATCLEARRSTYLTTRISTDRETAGSATGIFSGRRGDAS